MRSASVKSKAFMQDGYRLDPTIHLSEGVAARRQLTSLPFELSTVGQNAERVFIGNIFSRVFVQKPEYGVPYLAASDTVLSNLNTGRFLSKKQAAELSYLMLEKDWILITCSGTLGNVTFTDASFEGHIATHDLIRVVPSSNKVNKYTLFAFLASKYGYFQLTQNRFGGVVKHINDEQAKSIIVPVFPSSLQDAIKDLIIETTTLRESAKRIQSQAWDLFLQESQIDEIGIDEYDYYGPSIPERKVSCYSLSIKDISTISINAFNHSERIRNLKNRISSHVETKPLVECLDSPGLFSTGSFPRVEVAPGNGIELINQRDIFDSIVKGKYISRRGVKTTNLLRKDEVIIAGVGTLAESESFCRCVYGNSYLAGKLISGEFIRMKTNSNVPSGYLFLWLSSEYGFRLIRNTQAGTKLCRPIPKLLEQIPIPILSKERMNAIDQLVKESQEMLAKASFKELEAIAMIEREIDKWN